MKFLILISVLLLSGCGVSNYLNEAPKPITIVAISKAGVLFEDGEGNFEFFNSSSYPIRSIIRSGYKVGDVVGETKAECSNKPIAHRKGDQVINGVTFFNPPLKG